MRAPWPVLPHPWTRALLLHILTAGKSAITLAADRGNTRLQQLFVKAVPCPRECALQHSAWFLCSCMLAAT